MCTAVECKHLVIMIFIWPCKGHNECQGHILVKQYESLVKLRTLCAINRNTVCYGIVLLVHCKAKNNNSTSSYSGTKCQLFPLTKDLVFQGHLVSADPADWHTQSVTDRCAYWQQGRDPYVSVRLCRWYKNSQNKKKSIFVLQNVHYYWYFIQISTLTCPEGSKYLSTQILIWSKSIG